MLRSQLTPVRQTVRIWVIAPSEQLRQGQRYDHEYEYELYSVEPGSLAVQGVLEILDAAARCRDFVAFTVELPTDLPLELDLARYHSEGDNRS
jgi:hypothetical protein